MQRALWWRFIRVYFFGLGMVFATSQAMEAELSLLGKAFANFNTKMRAAMPKFSDESSERLNAEISKWSLQFAQRLEAISLSDEDKVKIVEALSIFLSQVIQIYEEVCQGSETTSEKGRAWSIFVELRNYAEEILLEAGEGTLIDRFKRLSIKGRKALRRFYPSNPYIVSGAISGLYLFNVMYSCGFFNEGAHVHSEFIQNIGAWMALELLETSDQIDTLLDQMITLF